MMKQAVKFWFFDGETMIDAYFKNEEDGFTWGKNYGLEYFKHEEKYIEKEIFDGL